MRGRDGWTDRQTEAEIETDKDQDTHTDIDIHTYIDTYIHKYKHCTLNVNMLNSACVRAQAGNLKSLGADPSTSLSMYCDQEHLMRCVVSPVTS